MGRIGLLELLFLAIVGFAIFVLVKHFSARRRIDLPGFTLAALPDGPGTSRCVVWLVTTSNPRGSIRERDA